MAVFLMPEFISDLQSHKEPNFAKRVLNKTITKDGTLAQDADDHRYDGIADAWIRYVSQGRSAFRVIYITDGANVYLYRAGEHSIEDRLTEPGVREFEAAHAIAEPEAKTSEAAQLLTKEAASLSSQGAKKNRLLRNAPRPNIRSSILSRRKLPHKDIWLVAPYIDPELLQPTASIGKVLFDQIEDGSRVTLITAPPKDQNIDWLERLEEREIDIILYPRLHSKLFCFVLDENRKYERGLPAAHKLSSMLLVGSANITRPGLAIDETSHNEELCYAIPEEELPHVETYITSLITYGQDLATAKSLKARKMWGIVERGKW